MNSLPISWIDTLRRPRQPQISSENVFVSLDEVQKLLTTPVPEESLALLRDKAAAAMLFLSGMRASAFTTLPIEAVDLDNLRLRQWPELGVHTKNGKKATTFLLNIPEILAPVRQWDVIVRKSLPGSSPWYAPIAHTWGDQFLSQDEPGKTRSQALQKRLSCCFPLQTLNSNHLTNSGMDTPSTGYFMLRRMADYKAVSMNLMHESIEITDSTYAPMLSSDVQERIAGLSGKATSTPGDELEVFL